MDAAYAAGLTDGEGCLYLGGYRGGRWMSARIDVGMSVRARPLLEELRTDWGGTVALARPASRKWQAAYRWTLIGKATVPFLTAVLPELRLKAAQARILLAFQAMIAELGWTDESHAEAVKMAEECRRLNRKGPQIGAPQDEAFALLVGGIWMEPAQMDLFSRSGWRRYFGGWPPSGTWASGRAYRLPRLAPRTFGTVSGLWPTATTEERRNIVASRRPGQQERLTQRLARTILPTPRSSDSRQPGPANTDNLVGLLKANRKRMMGPSPTVSDARGSRKSPGQKKSGTHLTDWLLPTATRADARRAGNFGRGEGNPTLPGALRELFPTPNARDWRSAKGMKPRDAHALNLPEYLANRWSHAGRRASSRAMPSSGRHGRTGGGTGRSGRRSRR